jgi:PAS domain S-box-containing protein
MRIVNSACREVLGIIDEPSLVGRKLADIHPTYQDYDASGSLTPVNEAPLALAIQGHTTINQERRIVTKQGMVRWILVSASPIYNATDELIAAYLVFPEITDRKRMEETLRITQFAIEHMADATLWMTKEEGRIMYVNQAACHLLGYTRDELHGLTMLDIDPSLSLTEWHNNFDQLQNQMSIQYESSYQSKDGELIPVEVTANYVEFGGRVFNYALIRNVSERKKSEAALLRQLDELMTWQKVTIGRENRIRDLKKEVNKLMSESGKPARYLEEN